MSVKGIWQGWTTIENADLCQELLHKEIFPAGCDRFSGEGLYIIIHSGIGYESVEALG